MVDRNDEDTPIKPINMTSLNEEDKQIEENLNDKEAEDQIPFYLKKDELKRIRGNRMCKYYAHHQTCTAEKKKNGCEYLHDSFVRAAHDILKLNIPFGKIIPVEETRERLLPNYDANNR